METEASRTVTADVTVYGVHRTGRYPLPARLAYRADRPLAVELVLRPGTGPDEIVWEFGRDLLTSGQEAQAGSGEVLVYPSTAAGVVCVALASGAARTLFELDAADVSTFLARTEALVRSGSETLDVDETIRRLLGG